ncbi:MAG: universal stress protein [Gammaproteobacteria bacterium]|nr:MAG: universal stress protein [Gammaproteobacteria bacterium]
MYTNLLIPTDGSRLSAKAVKSGIELAKSLGARVTGVFVTEPYRPPVYGEAAVYLPELTPQRYLQAVVAEAKQALAGIERQAKKAGVDCATVIVNGDQAWRGIIRTAKSKKCDLVVMASHGRSGLTGLLLGSQTSKVLTHSKVPVLVCR